MTLPKWATTVTPFSKMLALVIFITFPIIGFILGIQYQANLEFSQKINSLRLNDVSQKVPISKTTNLNPPSSNNINQETPFPETINWKEYINTQYKYSFKYPSSYSIFKTPTNNSDINQADFIYINTISTSMIPLDGYGGFTIQAGLNKNPTESLDQIISEPSQDVDLVPGSRQKLSINGFSGYSELINVKGGYSFKYVHIYNGDQIVTLDIRSSGKNINIPVEQLKNFSVFEQMVNTFKFTTPSSNQLKSTMTLSALSIDVPSDWYIFNETTNSLYFEPINGEKTPAPQGFHFDVIDDSDNLPLSRWVSIYGEKNSIGTSNQGAQVSSVIYNSLNWEKVENQSIVIIAGGGEYVSYGTVYKNKLYLLIRNGASQEIMDKVVQNIKAI